VAEVVVVGGGITGIQAALDIAQHGVAVRLIEKEPTIGGHMAMLDKTFPTNDCSMCILSPKMVQPWMIAPWPTETRSPMIVGWPVEQWTVALSWILDPAPMTIRSRSPLSTAPNQTPDRSPMVTSPRRVAFSAMKTSSPMRRLWFILIVLVAHDYE